MGNGCTMEKYSQKIHYIRMFVTKKTAIKDYTDE